jgi:hypothetical protein
LELVLCLRLADVDEPGDAELVDDNAELIAPGLLLHRHRGVPAFSALATCSLIPRRVRRARSARHW